MPRHDAPMMRFVVVGDASPSDQLGYGDYCWHALAFVVTESIDNLLEMLNLNIKGKPFALRKWSRTKQPYRMDFMKFASQIRQKDDLIFCVSAQRESKIRHNGRIWLKRLYGNLPPPNYSKKRKPRFPIGPTIIDGKEVGPLSITFDQLAVMFWYVQSLWLLQMEFYGKLQENVTLDVIFDRFPGDLDVGVKMGLFHNLLVRLTQGTVSIREKPIEATWLNAELLVDNLAGLYSVVYNTPRSKIAEKFRMYEASFHTVLFN